MMRLITLLVALLLGLLPLRSQSTTDFAERFMQLNTGTTRLQCITVGPGMMEKMLKLSEERANPEEQRLTDLLTQCKSLRIVKTQDEADTWRARAVALLEKSRPRYRIYRTNEVNADGSDRLWVRKKGRNIVEVIVLTAPDTGNFSVVDATGTLSEELIRRIFAR